MCYSATASFSASAVLLVTGSILVCRIKEKKYLFLALIPVFFAVQQAMEGCIWLKLEPSQWFKNIYLLFAYTFWPIWIPLSLLMVEKNKQRRKIQLALLWIGIIMSTYLLFTISDTHPYITCHSIQYENKKVSAQFGNFGILLYFAVTIGSVFTSSLSFSKILALFFSVFAIFIFVFDRFYFASLWCFWSAVISILLCFYLPTRKKC
ncbi:MAG: hypothetical protein FJZ57_02620 [Chlamydiae bacterium]|nr:hypothetical protein [Chlamydiota bacterium]